MGTAPYYCDFMRELVERDATKDIFVQCMIYLLSEIFKD